MTEKFINNKKSKIRCAIYTRKSCEEGLEQDFNSLDAQREACESYIKSQQHEGWVLLEKQYNDGGFSGGNLERPALKELFKDIAEDKIDIVVVYKVDRLTRSLLDFAKIVELFDSHNASFVSITQNFNTTTSMGRLTLNILLSFAQFEREVTGERIRDKIAASKKKGMWMGGRVPIGYKKENKKLIISENDAKTVQQIFKKYLELKSVPKLKEYLAEHNITSNKNNYFEKGQLYHILQNKVYIGRITHKGKVYNGEHQAIIEEDVFKDVQKLLSDNISDNNSQKSATNSLLAGILYDDNGNRMSPSHSNTRKKKYRYYVSLAITKFKKSQAGTISKLPANEIEKFVVSEIENYFSDTKILQNYICDLKIQEQNIILNKLKNAEIFTPQVIKNIVEKVTVSKDWIEIILKQNKIQEFLYNLCSIQNNKKSEEIFITLKKDIRISTGSSKGCNVLILKNGETQESNINKNLVKAIVRSYYWHELLLSGKVKNTKDIQKLEKLKDNSYIKQVLNLRFLSPKIVENIIQGTQPKDLTVSKLFNIKTYNWQEQEKLVNLL